MHISDGFLNDNLLAVLLGSTCCVFGYCFGKIVKNILVVSKSLVTTCENVFVKQNTLYFSKDVAKVFQKMMFVAIWIFAF